MLRRSEIATLINRVRALPADRVQERPELSLYYSWAHLLNGSSQELVESCMPQATGDGRIDSIAALIYAFLAVFQGELAQARTLSRQVLAELDESEQFWRSQAAWILSATYADMLEQPSVGELTALEEAVQIGQETGNLMVTAAAMCEQAHNLRRYGKLHEAKTVYEQALALAVDKKGRPYPIAGEALMGLGQLALEWNDLETAERQLLEGIEKTLLWREIAAFSGYLLLAQLRQVQGDSAGVNATMEEARQLALRFDATEYDDLIVAAYRARLWIDQYQLDKVAHWAEERGLLDGRPAVQAGADYREALRCYEEIVLARLWLVQGKAENALALLDRNLPPIEAWGRVRMVIETQLLRVQAFLKMDDLQAAVDALDRALTLGEPGGFVIMPDAFIGDELSSDGWQQVQSHLAHSRNGSPETPFAVRSSALSEDSAQASFAGEFETVLDVYSDEMIREAIYTVRRSRLSDRVQAYTQAKGMDLNHEVAVVVQRLVRAEISGILFTADPVTGSNASMSGNYIHGLGDELVSGEVEPFTFTLNRPKGSYDGPPELQQ